MVSSYLQFKLYSIKVSCVPYFRSVGVSNFNVHHLEGLRSKGLPTPSVNQIELHPWLQPRELIDYCRRHEITLMGYSPLVKSHVLNCDQVCNLGKK